MFPVLKDSKVLCSVKQIPEIILNYLEILHKERDPNFNDYVKVIINQEDLKNPLHRSWDKVYHKINLVFKNNMKDLKEYAIKFLGIYKGIHGSKWTENAKDLKILSDNLDHLPTESKFQVFSIRESYYSDLN
jgi:hypothetical protein